MQKQDKPTEAGLLAYAKSLADARVADEALRRSDDCIAFDACEALDCFALTGCILWVYYSEQPEDWGPHTVGSYYEQTVLLLETPAGLFPIPDEQAKEYDFEQALALHYAAHNPGAESNRASAMGRAREKEFSA
jgi:hypothetical protein